MYFHFVTLFLGTLAYRVACSGSDTSSSSLTTIEAHRHEPRALPTSTVLFGSAENYVQFVTDSSAPAPTGADFTLISRAQPSGGVDLYPGPDLQGKVQDAVLTNCVQFDSPACQSSVAALLDPNEVGLQSRQVGTLIAVSVWLSGLAVAALTMVFSSGWGTQANGSFHLPQTDIAQVQSATSASVLVVATATDDTNAMSITATSTPGAFEGNVTVDANGDLSINLPGDFAAILNDLIAQNGAFANVNKERALDSDILDCISTVTDTVLQNVVEGGAAPLILVNGAMRLPADADLLRALNAMVEGGGRAAVAALSLAPDAANFLIELSLWVVYAKLVDKLTIPQSTKISADQLDKDCSGAETSCGDDTCKGQNGLCTTGPNKDCPCTDDCPSEDVAPDCNNCGGGNGTCLGIADHNILWQGCPCFTDIRFSYPYLGPLAFLEAQLTLDTLSFLTVAELAQCDPVTYQVDTKLFSSLITTFCQNNLDLESDVEETLTYQNTTSPANWTAYAGWGFKLQWTVAPDPSLNPNPPNTLCNDTWSFFINGNGCSNDTQTMAASGVYSPNAGIAVYNITKPTATTSPAPAGPTPTKEILLIWDTPPVSGPTFYDFYEQSLGFAASLDNSCGAIVTNNVPFWTINDPDQGRVDPNRPKNGFTRKAPGKLGPIGKGNACFYEEDVLNTATISCIDNTWPCTPPASALAGTVEPNNGACGGINNVRQLVMVCPFSE